FTRAIEDCTRYLKLETGDVDETAYAHYQRGVCLAQSQREADALADFTAALRLKPTHEGAIHDRAVLFLFTGKFKEAIADCDAALRLKPRQGDLHAIRGVCRKHLGAVDAALPDLEEAIALGFSMPGLFVERAEVYLLQKQPEKALADLNKVI